MVGKKLVGVALSLLTTAVIAGCGAAQSNNSAGGHSNGAEVGSTRQDPNPPFVNRLKDLPATPDPRFDPTSARASIYSDITVYAANGRKVVLDAKNTPILFVAYWCPHCQRTLVLLNKNRQSLSQFPTLVSMGFAPGTSLAEEVRITQEEMNYFHINHVKEYYYLGSNSQKLTPQGYPTLVFPGKRGVLAMFGEHTLSAWQQALSLR